MTRNAVVHRAGEPIEHVYFRLSGMISVLALMRTGDAIETAIIGREGVVIAARPLRRASQPSLAPASIGPPKQITQS